MKAFLTMITLTVVLFAGHPADAMSRKPPRDHGPLIVDDSCMGPDAEMLFPACRRYGDVKPG